MSEGARPGSDPDGIEPATAERVGLLLDEVMADLRQERAARMRSRKDAGDLPQALVALCAHLVWQQVSITARQRDAVAELLELTPPYDDNPYQRDPAATLRLLNVNGVQSPEGAALSERVRRSAELRRLVAELLERLGPRAEECPDVVRSQLCAGYGRWAFEELVHWLVRAQVPVTPAERDIVTSAAALVGPRPGRLRGLRVDGSQ